MASIQKIGHPRSGTKKTHQVSKTPMLLLFLLASITATAFFASFYLSTTTTTSSSTGGIDLSTLSTLLLRGSSPLPTTVTLHTSEGNILIEFRPDLAPDSVAYVRSLLTSTVPCHKCRFYRAEQGILQGILTKEDKDDPSSSSSITPNVILGKCPLTPDELQTYRTTVNEPKAKCHGPIMTRGMVGWAAGEGGPDFFIDYYPKPADWWGHDHTVWGEIVDEESLDVVERMLKLPTHEDGLMMLDTPIPIELQ